MTDVPEKAVEAAARAMLVWNRPEPDYLSEAMRCVQDEADLPAYKELAAVALSAAHLVQEGLAEWQEEREKLTRLVRDAYNEAFIEGAKEHTPKGGKPWSESRARRALSGDAT